MFQVRFRGRGGQGVVTAAGLLASAASGEDRHAHAFPGSGPERIGAPVMSSCRIDDKPIRTREPVTGPDALIIQDPALPHQADLLAGLRRGGYLLVNSARGFGELGLDEFVRGFHRDRPLVVPASPLAMTRLGGGYRDATKRNMPRAWFDPLPHTHVALDDAIEQGALFCNILATAPVPAAGAQVVGTKPPRKPERAATSVTEPTSGSPTTRTAPP